MERFLDYKKVQPAAWSAVGLVVETDRVELKLVLPPADLRAIFRQGPMTPFG